MEVPNDCSINELAFNFVQLNSMICLQGNSYVDFLGVVSNISSKNQVQVRSGEQKVKRLITLADESMYSVDCCVWQEHADLFDNVSIGTPVVCKGARLVDFQG